MFWGSSSLDLKITLVALIIALIISVVIYLKSNKKLLSVFIFSFAGNLSIFLMILTNSMMFRFYKIEWFKAFSLSVWPWINLALLILLVINFIKNKNAKAK